jgi:hypothetical protein
MSQHDTVRFLASFFQPSEETPDAERLLNDPSLRSVALEGALWAVDKAPGATPGDAWGVLNGVTYWADHMAGRSADTRLFNSWLGATGRQKADVKKKLLELV